MKRNIHLLGLLGVLALSSCNLGGGTGGNNSLSGVVTQGRASEAVAGATVTAGSATTTSDAAGHFSLNGLGQHTTVLVKKDGFASSQFENVDTTQASPLDAIMLPIFDPELPTTPPKVTVTGVKDGDTVGGSDLTVKIKAEVADPTHNTLKFGFASLEVSAGISGTLNLGRVKHEFSNARLAEQEVTFTKSDFAAFKGDLELHFVVYDLNGNRTEVIRHVKAAGVTNAAAVTAPTNVSPFALTFGDNVTFTPNSVQPEVVKSLRALARGDTSKLNALPTGTTDTVTPQAAPSGRTLWVDVEFNYAAEAPRAFELWRSTDGTSFTKVVTIRPATALLDEETSLFRIRDTGSMLTAGVKTYYKVRAVSDAGSADSDVQDVTPLGAFSIKLLSPGQATTGVDRSPIFRWASTGGSETNYYKVIVLDRLAAESQTTAWLSQTIENETEAVYNFDGRAALRSLQAYHAYDWQIAGITVSKDEKAVSMGADYFNVFQLLPAASVAPKSGQINEFVTGGL